MTPLPKQPLSPTSGVVRHTDKVVALQDALARVPQTERVAVMLEHEATGVCSCTTMNRLAICVTLQKQAGRYGIFETSGRAKREGFGIVTRHATDPKLFVFIDTRPAEVAP
jgi:hypothetical protein